VNVLLFFVNKKLKIKWNMEGGGVGEVKEGKKYTSISILLTLCATQQGFCFLVMYGLCFFREMYCSFCEVRH
jgi:hypothetical protein